MADKMMRISGRTSTGLAKAIKVDTEGEVLVKTLSVNKRLGNVFTVAAGEMTTFETNVEGYKSFELSWYSPADGLGFVENTEVEIIYHLDLGQTASASSTFSLSLDKDSGVFKGSRGSYCIDNMIAQTVKNRWLTIIFKNNTSESLGLYYPTLILK